MTKNITLRSVLVSDAPALLNIYAPYVLETPITFEYEVPSVKEFEERILKITQNYPYLAAEAEGRILGYAYASSFKERAAYNWSAEVSVYVDKSFLHLGIGTLLYTELEQCLKQQNVCNSCACIAYPNPESIGFHQAFGYKMAAHFTKSGYKFDTWYDMVWMEKILCPHKVPPNPFIPYPQLQKSV